MSLRAKRTKWRRNLKVRATRLVERLNKQWTDTSMAGLSEVATQELGAVAAHYYRLGRAAGIAEGRKRAVENQA